MGITEPLKVVSCSISSIAQDFGNTVFFLMLVIITYAGISRTTGRPRRLMGPRKMPGDSLVRDKMDHLSGFPICPHPAVFLQALLPTLPPH